MALLTFLGSQLASALGSAAAEPVKKTVAEKAKAIIQRVANEPKGGELRRAIRVSQLLALQQTIKAYEKLEFASFRQRAQTSGPGFTAENITLPLTQWINPAVTGGASLEPDIELLTPDEAAAWARRIQTFEAGLEQAFASPAPGDNNAEKRLLYLRRLGEDWIVDEAKFKAGNQTDWARFESLIRDGNDDFKGWWRSFQAYLAFAITQNQDVRAVLEQQEFAKILGLQLDLRDAVAGLKAGFDSYASDIAQSLGALIDANAPDLDPPPETQDSQTLSGFKSLYFGARFDDFVGRQADLDFLDAFLHAPAPFAWQIIYGEGGVGKSRLALNQMLKLPDDWDKGFLLQSSLGLKQIRQWRPRRHRFIIIDYAATNTATVGKFLVDLQATAPHFGGQRVRVLLIERRADEDWLRRLKAAEHWTLVDPLEYQPPRKLFRSAMTNF